MPSPVQNGVVYRPQFFDGEGLVYSDLNALSAARIYINDLVLGAMMRVAQNTIGPGAELESSAHLYALGHSGAPRNVATTNGFGCNPGPLFCVAPGTIPDGTTPRVLTYYLSQNEITGAFAAGDATHSRFDAVYVRITEVDGPTINRDFQDAVTGVVTTTPVATTKQTKLEWVVVAGTPAALPVVAAAPDSSWASWGVWYIPKAWNSQMVTMFSSGGSNIFDYRVPLGITRHLCDVSRMYGLGLTGTTVDPSSGYATSTSTGLIIGAACGVRGGRVMACGFTANQQNTGSRNQVLIRSRGGAGLPSIQPPNWATIYGGIRAGDPTIAYSDTLGYVLMNGQWVDGGGTPVSTTASGFQLLPLWSNGYGSEAEDLGQMGGGALSGASVGDNAWVTCNWNAAGTTDNLIACTFDIAG